MNAPQPIRALTPFGETQITQRTDRLCQRARLLMQWGLFLTMVTAGGVGTAHAQVPTIPGGADINRVQPLPDKLLPRLSPQKPAVIDTGALPVPEGLNKISFELKAVKIEGATFFPLQEIAKLYETQLGQKVSLDLVWELANRITEKYRNAGYFLSRAFVPTQKIEDGIITLRVVEGYIATVEWEGDLKNRVAASSIVQSLIAELKQVRPLNSASIESYLLRLNDLPGLSFRALIKPAKEADIYSGATALVLTPSQKDGKGEMRVSNSGSRFLGPNLANISYEDSFFSMQQSSVSLQSSLPSEELRFGSLGHMVVLSPRWMLGMRAGYTGANPGAGLRNFDIRSTSKDLGIELTYKYIRQRIENLDLTLGLDSKDTASDLNGNSSPLVRDHARALRGSISYNTLDRWNGQHDATVKFSRGLTLLDGSRVGDNNLSRAQANPAFSKAELSYKRQQLVGDHYLLTNQLAGQLASDPLLVSEEFGYGGSSLGRAYDPSEISGDHG
ncbi:MAG: ShlB/FhaC/HecB family hemolysin secretion/activation protein, partial [Alphaproteobacteria bacterium]|nr:ShlB/FhaC/HecB family hemolysin secretion/activation protein [Alphaproteobacteria bacterium]